MIGQTISHYRITEKLGAGGMGTVYKAWDTHLERFVAIKMLPAEKVSDPQRKTRFVQEAKAASALNHPNIITIYDVVSQDGCDFIAMEYVSGKTLDEIIPRKGMKLGEALKVAVQVADALARTHATGIVHRDLKPANTMVDEHGLVKVLDFGLAKLTEPTPPDGSSSAATVAMGDKPITEDGIVVGTVSYMSPEQAEGKKVDGRSDIFSLGSLLYEMVTGQQAFRAESNLSTLAAIISKDPAPLPAEIPPDLGKIINRCLRKDPGRRFQTMADLKVAIEELKEESDSGKLSAVALPPSRQPRYGTWLFALVGAVAVGVVAFLFFRPDDRLSQASLAAVPLTSFPGQEQSPSFSPDGNQLAFLWNGEKQDNTDIYVKLIRPGSPIRITSDPAREYDPAWSPDGRWIAFERLLPEGKAGVFLVPALGGPERKLAETSSKSFYGSLPSPHIAWLPDSKWLVIADKTSSTESCSLACLSIATGERRRLTQSSSDLYANDSGVAVSPDGRTIAFVRMVAWGASEIYLLPISESQVPQGEPRKLTSEGQWITHPAWTADGREIIFSMGTFRGTASLWRIADSVRDARPQRVASVGEDGVTPAISPSKPARLAYARNQLDVNIWRLDLSEAGKGQPAGKFIASSRNDFYPRYSPDGKRIAFHSDRSGSTQLWMANDDGTNAIPLTSQPAFGANSPAWSPDSQQILFGAAMNGLRKMFLARVTGEDPILLPESLAGWSRDGRWTYLNSQGQIWRKAVAGGEAKQITHWGGTFVSESPDGTQVYFSPSTSPPSLWRVPVEGGAEIEVLHAVHHNSNVWVTDRGIYFVPARTPAPPFVIQLFHPATAKIELVVTLEKAPHFGLVVSPDGRWLLYSQIDQTSCDLMLVENFR